MDGGGSEEGAMEVVERKKTDKECHWRQYCCCWWVG